MSQPRTAKPTAQKSITELTDFLHSAYDFIARMASSQIEVGLSVDGRGQLRAKEIASLTWAMLTDAEGNIGYAIHLVDQASKGSSGRVIPLNKELKAALEQIQKAQVGAGRRPSWSRPKEPGRPAPRRS
jgi:hypothetical protein